MEDEVISKNERSSPRCPGYFFPATERLGQAVRPIKERGVSYGQASQDLGVHTSQLRDWVKKFADDPQHAVTKCRFDLLISSSWPCLERQS